VRNQSYGTTYVKNYQAMGETNFKNSANRGDTKVDNLVGTSGSVQNFGLLMILDAQPDIKTQIANL